jgi:hypothetical protein
MSSASKMNKYKKRCELCVAVGAKRLILATENTIHPQGSAGQPDGNRVAANAGCARQWSSSPLLVLWLGAADFNARITQ